MQMEKPMKRIIVKSGKEPNENQCQKETVKKMTETYNYTHANDKWG